MIVACKEVLEGAPETSLYILDTDLITDPALRKRFENPETFDFHTTDYSVTINCDESNSLSEAVVEPPQLVERLIDVWVE